MSRRSRYKTVRSASLAYPRPEVQPTPSSSPDDEGPAGPVARSPATPYEAAQIRQIAAWKAEEPHLRAGLLGKAAERIAHFAERFIPPNVAQGAIQKVYDEAELCATRGDIERHAKVESLDELRHRPLEDCDQLSRGVAAWGEGIAVVGGAATGLGGFLTSALDVPFLLGIALRTIIRVGHCYGYALDNPKDRRAVLGILLVAATDDPAKKRKLLGKMREVEDWLIEEAEEDLIEDEALELLLQIEIFDDIPGLGAVSAGVGNYAFTHHVANAARRVFQEWWLRDNGKVGTIDPHAFTPDEADAHHQPGVISWAVYTGSYYLGFGASWPAWLVARSFRGVENALTRGTRAGSDAATLDAARAVDRIGQVQIPALGKPAAPALAPA